MDVARELELFQVFISERQLAQRLAITRKYTRQARGRARNCANLSLVLLGLVEPDYYLESCTVRGVGTTEEERFDYIKSALAQCGARDALVEERIVPVEGFARLTDSITPGYGIMFTIRQIADPDRGLHSVLLRKTEGGELEYIEPQIELEGVPYPVKFVGMQQIQRYLREAVSELSIQYVSDTISKEDSLSEKCKVSRAPMLMEGGRARRTRLTRLTRKNGKKTKKSRKQHGVRTHRRRH